MYYIYFNIIWEKLYPPHLRLALHLAWGNVLMKPLQWLRGLTFDTYANGLPSNKWDFSTSYALGDLVYYTDRCVYECTIAGSGNFPTVAVTYWKKVLDNHIGVHERVKYNSQKILFEYSLNRWFDCYSPSPLIYITNNVYSIMFLLGGQNGLTSSSMPLSSAYSATFMGNSFGYSSYQFTIYVPIGVYNTLGSSNTERTNTIRSFADKYVLVGIQYNVATF